MSSLRVQLINSIAELREKAMLWDDLWQRSTSANPLARAELIAQWVEQFAPDARFCALVVESQGRFLAALPIVGSRKLKIIPVGINPSNAWSMCGQLMVDFQEDTKHIFKMLISGLQKLPFSILWLDFIRFNAAEWLLFKETLAAHEFRSQWVPRYPTAVVQLSGSYEEKVSKWKKKEISSINKRFKKYYSPDKFQLLQLCSPSEISNHLQACFALENKGWKREGGSILHRNMGAFFTKQAMTLSERGELVLYVLYIDGIIAAFNYCYVAKDTVFSQKIGYDQDFREYAPGQVLQLLINDELCKNERIQKIDFVGELMPHQKVWCPTECMNGQIVIPINTLTGHLFFSLYDMVMPKIRQLRKIWI